MRRFKGEHGGLDDTFLGLSRECGVCHEDQDPHGLQFQGRPCTDCHTQDTWEGAREFSHDETAYPLTGLHRQVDCTGCHVPATEGGGLVYRPVAYDTCGVCHGDEDPHGGEMGQACAGCHTTEGWNRLDRSAFESRFDHASTGFELLGRHEGLECSSCHGPPGERPASVRVAFRPGDGGGSYPAPVAESCGSCHRDAHGESLEEWADGGACVACHDVEAWYPSSFGPDRHDDETAFPLTGAHRVAPCSTCHGEDPPEDWRGLTFEAPGTSCVSCHAEDDPHGDQFQDRGCDTCHDTRAFAPVRVDHDLTRFPLTGAHRELECGACHTTTSSGSGQAPRTRYRPLPLDCRGCHGDGP